MKEALPWSESLTGQAPPPGDDAGRPAGDWLLLQPTPMARANLTLLQCYLGIPGVVGIGVPLIGTPQNYSGQGPAKL